MSKLENMESNVSLAKFSGWEHWINDGSIQVYRKGDVSKSIHDLKFHESWDLLMPVMEKIETTLYPLGDKVGGHGKRNGATHATGDFHIFYDEREEFQGWTWSVGLLFNRTIAENTEREKTKLEAIYNAVVAFIKWYNEQPK